MKRFILGTAGHVDHGKTALIRALTGIECDTHTEEKTRGITINLGFAHLDLENDMSFGIVDVPGHRDFVHTMVGGASGIDLALLVVAADSGVMPQTREHLEIMDVLGIHGGLVAVTKTDLADQDIVDLATEEIRELLVGTFLEDCPIVCVSSVTGDGIDDLRVALQKTAAALAERTAGEVFRLFPDRIFSVSGFGTVVTGSVIGGSLKTGETAYLLPNAKKLRVRRLERHGQEVEEVSAGDRASMNLVGLDRDDFERGMVISDRVLSVTTMVDARMRLFENTARTFEIWNQVVFHLGTYERQAKIHVIDKDHLIGGEAALVQIHLDGPCVVQHGDRFVIRSTSSDVTLGGGEIIDPSPLHHRRRTEKAAKAMGKIADGKMPELVASEIKKQFKPLNSVELAELLNVSSDEIHAVVTDNPPEDIACYTHENKLYLLTTDERDRLLEGVTRLLTDHHRQNPLDEKGRKAEEMAGTLGVERRSSAEVVFRLLLEELETEKKIRRAGHTFVLFGHSVEITPERARYIELVESFLKKSKMSTPSISDLVIEAGREGIEEQEVMQILRHLVESGKAHFVDREYLHASHVDRCRKTLLQALIKEPKGISVATFRDLVSGNRKICLLLFSIFDAEGIISRVGDVRMLTKKGEAAAR
ncbi:MAG: selenocysteine-specific translation elongation factor [Deltaproteobacteria bacterium]|nr:selenocysteine-specific translation elongation factor [Deltaproteobacteria bacterium]